jgi:hypothetical protein
MQCRSTSSRSSGSRLSQRATAARRPNAWVPLTTRGRRQAGDAVRQSLGGVGPAARHAAAQGPRSLRGGAGRVARDLLSEAGQTLLELLCRNRPATCTPNRGRAAELLATHHLDRGQAVPAAFAFERLFSPRSPGALPEVTLFKAALAFRLAGDDDGFKRAWKRLEDRAPDGLPRRPARRLDDLRRTSTTSAPVARRTAPSRPARRCWSHRGGSPWSAMGRRRPGCARPRRRGAVFPSFRGAPRAGGRCSRGRTPASWRSIVTRARPRGSGAPNARSKAWRATPTANGPTTTLGSGLRATTVWLPRCCSRTACSAPSPPTCAASTPWTIYRCRRSPSITPAASAEAGLGLSFNFAERLNDPVYHSRLVARIRRPARSSGRSAAAGNGRGTGGRSLPGAAAAAGRVAVSARREESGAATGVLDSSRGELLWSQTLAYTRSRLLLDGGRRLHAMTPFLVDGFLLCPTGSGRSSPSIGCRTASSGPTPTARTSRRRSRTTVAVASGRASSSRRRRTSPPTGR